MNHLSKKLGFTLIELLVVIAIIGLLAGIILASLQTSREKALDAKVLQEVHQFQVAVQIFMSENNRYPDPGSTGSYCLSNTGCLVAGSTIANPSGELAGLIPETRENGDRFTLIKRAEALVGDKLPGYLTKNPTVSSQSGSWAGPIYAWDDTTKEANIIFTVKHETNGIASSRVYSNTPGLYIKSASGGDAYNFTY